MIIFPKSVDKVLEGKGTSTGFYSPLVLSIAQKENVSFDELQSINGTGLEGRVSKKDILAYIENRKSSKVSHRDTQIKVQDQVQVSTAERSTARIDSYHITNCL